MRTPNRPRRSVRFRPAALGIERLESLRLLSAVSPGPSDPAPPPADSSDMNDGDNQNPDAPTDPASDPDPTGDMNDQDPAVLPGPSLDSDPDTAPLVNLATFTADAAALEGQAFAFAPPGGVDAMGAGDKDDLIKLINEKRDEMLAEFNGQIKLTQAVKDRFTETNAAIQKSFDAHKAEKLTLGSSPADKARSYSLDYIMAVEIQGLATCSFAIKIMDTNITWLNSEKAKVNAKFDEILNAIRKLNMAADPDVEDIPWYETDPVEIGY